ncbi:MAG: putative 4-hydroxybenzoate polyprenyltransferase [Planctomycetaceae bacterium]
MILNDGNRRLVAYNSDMFTRIRQLLELIRFSHTVFALPFALLSATLAWREREFRWQDLAGILLCMVFARSAAMAFNRLVDHKIDASNPRTVGRHLPAGLLPRSAVWIFTLITSAGFVASTLFFFPNRWPLYLSVPVLLFLLGYSFAKRWTAFSHYWLSAALMLSPLAVWIALGAEFAWTPVCLAAVIFFWVGGFDILYACQDADFDKTAGLRSIPARWGIPTALRIAMLSHAITVVCLFALWYLGGFGPIFLAGVILISGLLVYEHSLVRPDDLTRVNIAFFQVNAVISIGLFLVGLIDVLM